MSGQDGDEFGKEGTFILRECEGMLVIRLELRVENRLLTSPVCWTDSGNASGLKICKDNSREGKRLFSIKQKCQLIEGGGKRWRSGEIKGILLPEMGK